MESLGPIRYLLLLGVFAFGCKHRQDISQGASTVLDMTSPGAAMLIVGLDGPRDHGEINRGMLDGAARCIGNPNLECHLAIPRGDRTYRMLIANCTGHPRCKMHFFADDQDVLTLLSRLNGVVRVGLLIGHYTNRTIWDHEDLGADALDTAAAYPLVMRMCNSDQIAAGSDGLIPVGTGLLSEDDASYVDVIRRILEP